MSNTAISTRIDPGPVPVAVVTISGALDHESAPAFSAALRDLVANDHASIACDFTDVSHIASAGVGALLQKQEEARQAGGGIVIVAPRPDVRKVLDMLEIGRVVAIVDDLAAARRSLS